MILDLEIVNEGSGTGGRTWDRFRGVSVMISYPHDLGGDICGQLCVYAFGIVLIVVYAVGGCHMSVVLDPDEVNCVCGCFMDFMMFLVYFRDNNHDIITLTTSFESMKVMNGKLPSTPTTALSNGVLCMPFGLTSAPAAFQHFMNNIFSNMLNVCILNMKQHCEHVLKVF